MGVINTSLSLSVELTPGTINKGNISEFVVNNVDYITIPHFPTNSLKLTTKAVSQLSDVYGVDPSRTIPHIAARSITSKKHLTEVINNLKGMGVKRLLIVGGNPSEPQGPYRDAESVRRHITDIHKEFKLYCGVYPDTETASGVYLYKYELFDGGFTQLSLSPRKLESFKINTRIGVPSQADIGGLYRYMKICGVGPSLRYPMRNIVGFARYMTPNGFNTTKLVKAIQPHHSFHVYDFGRIEKTVEDLLDLDV
jgi:methylenetetrahydrofolate reductase (NADPH)